MFEVYLPIANIILDGLPVILLGALVGFLMWLFGVGEGFIMTPAMNIVFRVPMNVTLSSSLTQMAATSSSVSQHTEDNKDIKLIVMGASSNGFIG